MSVRPVVVLKPEPQRLDRILSPASRLRLQSEFDVVDLEGVADPRLLEPELRRAFAIVGQPDLSAETLNAAPGLRAVVNVEGNFFPNIDYPTAFRNGVRILGVGNAYAQAVAEFAVGLALDAARGISREDRAARAGTERYVAAGSSDSILLRGSHVSLIGFGNLGRALIELLAPFRAHLHVHDPWLPDSVMREAGAEPVGLDEALAVGDFVFVLAAATSENGHLLDRRALGLLKDGCRLILVSRAAVVDFDALLDALRDRPIHAAVDVWPEEPIPRDSPFRALENLTISPHRAGGIPQAFTAIGDMLVDDLCLMKAGLPPVRLQQANPELVGRYRNRPVT